MRVVFSGSFSDSSLNLACRLAEKFARHSDSLEFTGWFFTESSRLPIAGTTGGFAWETIGLDTSLRVSHSRRNLLLYREFLDSERYRNLRSLGLKLLNRRDFTGTFRLLEREVLLQRWVLITLDFFVSVKPNLLIFPVSPHLFMPVVAQYVANFLGIPVIHLQPCPIAPVVFPILVLGDEVHRIPVPSHASPVAEEILAVTQRQLSVLNNFGDPKYMQLQKERDEKVSKLWERARSILFTFRWIFRPRFPNSIDFSGVRELDSVVSRLARIVLTRYLEKSLRLSVDALSAGFRKQESYCIFALHYEPERTSIPEGLPIEFQADAVAIARAIVPPATQLVVKEHYSQISSALRGFLGRSHLMYDLIQDYENTSFAPTSSRLSELVIGSSCVFTLTGTVAIESVLKGVPVAYFGSPWWAGLPGTIRLNVSTQFSEILSLKMPSNAEVTEFLESLILGAGIVGAGSEPKEVLEKKLGDLPAEWDDLEATQLTAIVLDVLDLIGTHSGK